MKDCFNRELHFAVLLLKVCLGLNPSSSLCKHLCGISHLTNILSTHRIQDLDWHINIGCLDRTICGMQERIFPHQASSGHVWFELVLKPSTFA